MCDKPKKKMNPQYMWASRTAFWIGVLVVFPMFFIDTHKRASALANSIILLFYIWTTIGNYILGYRVDNPPKWSKWIIPAKWISEWKYLSYADPEVIRSNRMGLMRVVGGVVILTIFVLSILSWKL